MAEGQSTKDFRTQLYDDVWTKPIIALTEKYALSDNGIRKRCETLMIPVPPFGYWAKVKAGKVVEERPPLPPYEEISHDIGNLHDTESMQTAKKQGELLELRDLYGLSVEELAKMSGLDLLTTSSRKCFSEWCNSLVVPGRVQDFDDLISKHKAEFEYRSIRDREYPLGDEGLSRWRSAEKIKYRNNEPVLSITVSEGRLNRAYRIADTIIKSFRKLKATVHVDRTDKDNIRIDLLGSSISFDIQECKTKRRYSSPAAKQFRPLYEEIYDGRLQISWQVQLGHYSQKQNPHEMSFADSNEIMLEECFPKMILDACSEIFSGELASVLESKKEMIRYRKEESEKCARELAEKQNKQRNEMNSRKNAFLNGISDHAKKWFEYDRLSKYADELEAFAETLVDEKQAKLLYEYIRLVRQTAKEYSPIAYLLLEMEQISQG